MDENLPISEITRVQELHLKLIEAISFNDFDGKRVADGLRSVKNLWVGVIASHSYQPHPAFRLFDEIPEDNWRPDTLWIMAVDEQAGRQLTDLCRSEWNADEAGIMSDNQLKAIFGEVVMIDDEVLVQAWWD